jgi:single-strand DNA-binding protein
MASRSVNKVLLLGHLGKDAEGKFLPSGVHVAKFSVATSRRWKDKGSDEWKEETEWTNVSLWWSENLVPYLTKGKQVYVEGRLQTRNYEDKEGQKRYSTEVVADEVILVGGGGGEKQHGGGLVSQPRGAQQAKQTSPMELTDDDIPW